MTLAQTIISYRDRAMGAIVAVLTIAGLLLALVPERGAVASAPAPILIVATPTLGRIITPTAAPAAVAPIAALAAPTVAPPTVEPPTVAPDTAPIVAAAAPAPIEAHESAKNWISPDSYTLPGSALVYYVDSRGAVVEQRLPGSETWMAAAPDTPAPTAAPAVAPPSNYCPRCGWHR